MNFSNELNAALEAAVLGSKEIMEVYSGEIAVEMKDDRSPLTEADKRAHLAIKKVLDATGIPVLSEEGSSVPYDERKAWRRLWVVDPLDGTKEFIKRNGEFTVNIALVENGYPVLGVIMSPALGDLYFAESGKGVYKVHMDMDRDAVVAGDIIAHAKKLNADSHLPKEYTIIASRSHMSEETASFMEMKKQHHGVVHTISSGSALKFCLIAEGKAHCYPRFAPTMEWDTAAGQVLVEEAGRTLIDHNTGERMKYNREQLRNHWFLVE